MKILITGPESSGKTTLCNQLGREFGAVVRMEEARIYLEQFGPTYGSEDLIKIWKRQVKKEKSLDEEKKLIFCDTGHFVMAVWNVFKFESPRLKLDRLIEDLPLNYDHIFLCAPDLPWKTDPLRETADLKSREMLFERYRELIEAQGLDYTIISGLEDRMGIVLRKLYPPTATPWGTL